MESVLSVSKLSTESVGSRRELVANVHTADADATKQFRRVGGVYWAYSTRVQNNVYIGHMKWPNKIGLLKV